jgi:AcrR family transcriptional regulator
MTLFRERGYEGTGLAAILGRAGVNSGSLYHFFDGKGALLLAVLERYKELLRPLVFDPVFQRVEDPIERIFGVLEGYRRMLTTSGCTLGCPVAALALEMSEKSEAVRALVAENFEAWRLGIRQCLIDARSRLPRSADPDKLATFVLTVMEGGVMQARTHHCIEPFDAGVAQLRDYFGRLLTRRRRHARKRGG